jgi:hypothetical protein
VNRNAVTIDSPPHSTGLAFDIDYRYMSIAEQNFVMSELARIKNQGRIEVIRERNANFHVFAFLNGSRPGDDLVAAALEKAGAPVEEEAHQRNQRSPRRKQRAKPVKRVGREAMCGKRESAAVNREILEFFTSNHERSSRIS